MEKAGIEPAATTLAGRVRYLSCHPHSGAEGSRTPGLFDATEALFLLSYSPMAAAAMPRRQSAGMAACRVMLTLWTCQ